MAVAVKTVPVMTLLSIVVMTVMVTAVIHNDSITKSSSKGNNCNDNGNDHIDHDSSGKDSNSI